MNSGFKVIPAGEKDSGSIWKIRYHPKINETAINQESVNFAQHDRWFREKYFKDKDSKCFVLKNNDNTIGYCRFDLNKTGYVISIALHPDYQGRGLGRQLLIESMWQFGDEKAFLATIKKNNPTSLRLFLEAGFQIYGGDEVSHFLRK